jgi:hypothetical protein
MAIPETIEERLASCPVAAVYEVMDAVQEIKRLRAEITRLESLPQREYITQCPSCGWRNNG